MNLKAILNELNLPGGAACPADFDINSITDNSAKAGPGALFVAVQGTKADGHDFLPDAAERGACVALVSRTDVAPPPGMTLIHSDCPRRALSLIAHRLAGDPTRRMTVVGVTGTNGKTTVTYLMEAIFRAAGLEPGIIGTISYRWNGHEEPAPQTTPSPVELADTLARMQAGGVGAVAMEVSSHAIDQSRAEGVWFRAAALTNLTQDHLDYHHTMDAYELAKRRLFSEVLPVNPEGMAVLNLDDPAGRRFADAVRPERVIGYSLHRPEAGLRVERILFHKNGMMIDLDALGRPLRLETPMFGLFNAVNCVTATGLALAAGIDREAIGKGIATMTGAPGRFEFVRAGQPFPIIVDYAHTPDALQQVLLHARGFARRRLIAVFGCGGDRDPGKRPQMGRAAARLADEIIVTNDNPRTEQPQAIADAIVEGIKTCTHKIRFKVELDRKTAIEHAVRMAGAQDVVVIAGKGHEDYQILGSRKIHFDDREVARAAAKHRVGVKA